MTLNIKNTYFGFTDALKPMNKVKIENNLNKLIRFDGVVMSEKEFVYSRLTKFEAIPNMIENYSYYSRKTDSDTKPKTVYELAWTSKEPNHMGNYDSLSNDINKTLYDYAVYLVDNNFIDEQKAIEFIVAEQERLKAYDQAAIELLYQEKLKRESEEKAKEDFKVWLDHQAVNYNNSEKLTLGLHIFNTEQNGIDTKQMGRFLTLIDNIDNPMCKQKLKDWLHTGNPTSKKVFYHVTGIKLPSTDKATMPLLDSLTTKDYKVKITA